VVFTGYDAFAARCPRAAQIVLDIMADSSRSAALVGRRLMCLVQRNDPHVQFEPVGATPVAWNDAEWLDSRRQPDERLAAASESRGVCAIESCAVAVRP
jgi:hypothetical protein